MSSPLRRLARLLVLVCVLAVGFGPSSHEPASRAGDPLADPSVVAAEVRALRKLHLVRPDLIPYPIAYEVCC